MPTLDSCINSVFEPGNIGSSVGTTPTIIRSTRGTFIPAAANLVLSATAPIVLLSENIPAAANLVLSPTAPTVSLSAHRALSPAQGNLVLSPTAPTALRTANMAVSPAQGNLVLSPTAPTLGSAEAAAFLARTSGLDATHINAYTALIDGLVADGIWSKLDMLHVYATQDSTTALLNLVSSSYNGTSHGSPTFTADRGFTGVNNSSAVYIDTNFTPSTASSPQYVRDSAHFSAWSVVDITSSANPIMGHQVTGGVTSQIYPRFTDGKAYFRVNDAGSLAGVTNATPTGHYIANRSAANDVQGYKNASSILTSTSDASLAVSSIGFITLGFRTDSGVTVFGSAYQCAMASIGSSLNGTDATNFYNRLRTYMTAVGVP